MKHQLPPLNSLRVFEAAARHLSFTKAASELNVTQAAVSHQIKQLEERLGIPLFRRLGRSLLLTDAGQSLFPEITDAIGIMTNAIGRLHQNDQSGSLTLTTMDSFAVTWLVPRMSRFRKLHPDIDVRIMTSDGLVDMVQENIDLGIRFGNGYWQDLHSELLMEDAVFPVCSPELLNKETPLTVPSDLRHHTLLHDDMQTNWHDWCTAMHLDNVDTERGPVLAHSNLVIQAAVQGDGIALARGSLASDELAAGRLVRLFELSIPTDFAHYFVCPKSNLNRPKVKAFHDWLYDEVAKSSWASTHNPHAGKYK